MCNLAIYTYFCILFVMIGISSDPCGLQPSLSSSIPCPRPRTGISRQTVPLSQSVSQSWLLCRECHDYARILYGQNPISIILILSPSFSSPLHLRLFLLQGRVAVTFQTSDSKLITSPASWKGWNLTANLSTWRNLQLHLILAPISLHLDSGHVKWSPHSPQSAAGCP